MCDERRPSPWQRPRVAAEGELDLGENRRHASSAKWKGGWSWPYDHPYNLILNVAVGGAWGRAGGPIDDSIFPQRMLVDWVRVYQAGG